MSETIEEYKRENANLKRQLEVALQKLDTYENESLEKEGYYALKSWVKQQIDIVKDFKLKEEITKNPKDDKCYDRVKALGEDLKKMITDLNLLRAELKINTKDDEDYKRRLRTTPESVADNIGNTAGKNM